jgi:hypothetical protein
MQPILRGLHVLYEELNLVVAAHFHQRQARLHALERVAAIVSERVHRLLDRGAAFGSEHTLECGVVVLNVADNEYILRTRTRFPQQRRRLPDDSKKLLTGDFRGHPAEPGFGGRVHRNQRSALVDDEHAVGGSAERSLSVVRVASGT